MLLGWMWLSWGGFSFFLFYFIASILSVSLFFEMDLQG
jgi:hypothetical protein